MEIDQEKFELSLRKFLKKVGITSQQKIEESIREEIKKATLQNDNLKITAKLEIKEINLVHCVDGIICLRDN